jgi:DNA-binding response OmpR family regulator
VRNKCQALTRTQILQHVWDYDFYAGSNIVDVNVRYLRKKIDEGHETKLIKTIRGIGYSICDDA